MSFLKAIFRRNSRADHEQEWDEGWDQTLAGAEAEDNDAPDSSRIYSPRRAALPPEPAPAAEEDDWRTRTDTKAIVRQLATTEMRELLHRVAEHGAPARPVAPGAEARDTPPPEPRQDAAPPRPAKIWDLDEPDPAPRHPQAHARQPEPPRRAAQQAEAAPTSSRQRTRMLGFQPAAQQDVFDAPVAQASGGPVLFPTGWIVVTGGPGRGNSFTLGNGVSQIGRGSDQAVQLDFGDSSISRNNHAAIAFDAESGKFFLGHGGKANLVRLNGRPVLTTEELATNDVIRLGETELRFIGFCGTDFAWGEDREHDAAGR